MDGWIAVYPPTGSTAYEMEIRWAPRLYAPSEYGPRLPFTLLKNKFIIIIIIIIINELIMVT